jgi:glycosyltransferase involved in cell wall biosynthesis
MHRSGTSLVASLAAAAGVDMGDRLLGADRGNPLGYFEDIGFLSLQRRMLDESTPADDGGHRDWGWTEGERLDRSRFALFRDEARSLLEARRGAERPWGWKDPRTTLALDFWDEILEEPFYLFVYRYPWDVADSMQRLGAEVFLRNPEYAHWIWAFYNRHLLDFCRRRRERSLLVSTNALLRHPERFQVLLEERFGLRLPGERMREIVDDCMLRTLEGADPLIGLVAATSPESTRLLAELDAEADLPSTDLWEIPSAGEHRALSAPGVIPVRLSVVIPCLDHGELLIEAVASAERSISEPYELIVVDDGSRQPRTLEVLAALSAAGYFVVHQENQGLAAARNRGIELATSRYVVPLDSDNRLLPGFPEAAAGVLDEDPRAGVVYGDRSELGLRSGAIQVPEFDLDRLLTGNFIDACTVIRKRAWSECGGFDRNMPHQGWEDWDFWISAAERGWQFHHLPWVTFEYRVRPGSMIWRLASPEVGRPLQSYIVGKHRDLYLERLPQLLMEVQSAQRESRSLLDEAARLRREAEGRVEEIKALADERDRLAETAGRLAEVVDERDRVAGRLAETIREREALDAERRVLEVERGLLYRELESWRERVAFMEETGAWRWREHWIRLKGRWRRSF